MVAFLSSNQNWRTGGNRSIARTCQSGRDPKQLNRKLFRQEAIHNYRQSEARKLSPAGKGHIYSNKAYFHAINILDAVDLIRLGARAPLVCNLTKIEKATIRSLYHTIRGIPSPPGQAPFTDTWFLKNDLRQLHANLIWRLQQAITRTVRSDARVLIDVYEIYTQIVQQPILNITRAAFVPKLVSMNLWHERICQQCTLIYITAITNPLKICQACKLYYGHRGLRCIARS